MSDSADLLRAALSHHYVLERELGRGGMATVWLARDLKHERLVALKVLDPGVAATIGLDRFQHEIKFAARLQHPHILSVYDSGQSADQLWFTMPYVEGESLRDRLRCEGTVRLDEAIRITCEAAQALQYAHDHGVIHRDIKPENILLTADGSTLVGDFGIARAVGVQPTQHVTAPGLVVGTPSYLSPEQAAGSETLDGRSDVYSLACVLYEMLTGAPPFTGGTAQAILVGHLTKPPPPMHGTPDRLPDTVVRAITRALAKAPADRFASPQEFAKALRAPRTAAGAARRDRRRVGLLALAALAVLGVTYHAGRWIGSDARGATATGAVATALNRKLAQLTAGEGLEDWPAWSPDGASLAFVAEENGVRRLVVRTLATGEERHVSRAPNDVLQPAWAPDGRRLAFVRAKSAGTMLEPSDVYGWYDEGGDVWIIEPASASESKLVENAFGPAWSPDGSLIAVEASWAGPKRIWIVDARGRNPRQVSSDSSDAVVHVQPRWSPDGKRLVFRRVANTKSDIAVVDLASQTIRPVTDDAVLDTDPVWSADGRHILFSSARGGGVNLWRIAVSRDGRPTGPAEQLTNGAGDDVQAAPAPQGRRLAFTVRAINSDLWRLPVSPREGRTTGAPEALVRTTRMDSRGAWSPDGRAIAFNSDRVGEMNLWVRSLVDGSERRITSGPGGDYQPQWSPKGDGLVFFSARSGNNDVWTVQLADGRLTRLTDAPGMDINPFYSPDGGRIAFVSDRSGRAEVWMMNSDGSAEQQITSSGVWAGHFLRWTADGRGIVFRDGTGAQSRIFRVAVGDRTYVPLPEVSSGAHMSFSPDESLILDVRNHKALWVHPVDGRAPYEIFQFNEAGFRIDYPVWSPDGRWVLFDRAAPKGGDVWMLEGLE